MGLIATSVICPHGLLGTLVIDLYFNVFQQCQNMLSGGNIQGLTDWCPDEATRSVWCPIQEVGCAAVDRCICGKPTGHDWRLRLSHAVACSGVLLRAPTSGGHHALLSLHQIIFPYVSCITCHLCQCTFYNSSDWLARGIHMHINPWYLN